MSDQTSILAQTIGQYVKIIHKPDGTLTLERVDPRISPTSDPTLPIPVLSKDVTINESNNTWVRLFLPRRALSNHGSTSNHSHKKLPLIVFFHGSGFILLSAASTMFHDFCVDMADDVGAIVASVEYRLAPEHRLPAAYEDGIEALYWIKSSQEEWLKQYTDYSNCYIMGNSAGATIAYHSGLRAVEEMDHLEPLRIQGLILRQPFFGGTNRSGSELRLENDLVLPLFLTDLLWELALPIGVDRDHEYCNLRAKDGPEKLDKINELGWKVLVSGNGGDPLVDRGKELVELMEEKGVQVISDFDEEGGHGIEFVEPLKGKLLIGLVRGFISSFGA